MAQAQPWTTYIGDRYIAQGFDSVTAALQRARAQQIQQQQFETDIDLRKRGQDLGYYGGEADRAVSMYGIDTRGNQAAAEMTLRNDPSRVQPVPLMNPQTGAPMPGMYAIPMTGQILQPDDATAPGAQGGDPNAATPVKGPDGKVLGHKVILNGKETFVKPPSTSGLNYLGAPIAGQPTGTPVGAAGAASQFLKPDPLPTNPGGNNGNALFPFGTGTAQLDLPKVTSQADYDKLAPGTVYLDPNGKQRTKTAR